MSRVQLEGAVEEEPAGEEVTQETLQAVVGLKGKQVQ